MDDRLCLLVIVGSDDTGRKEALHDIWLTGARKEAHKATGGFLRRFGVKYPRATECLENDEDQELLW